MQERPAASHCWPWPVGCQGFGLSPDSGVAPSPSFSSVIGHWLDEGGAGELMRVPKGDSARSVRDRAVLAILLGGGLRRAEIAAVKIEQFRMIENRWVIADLIGKHGRVRSVPIPGWGKKRCRSLDRNGRLDVRVCLSAH